MGTSPHGSDPPRVGYQALLRAGVALTATGIAGGLGLDLLDREVSGTRVKGRFGTGERQIAVTAGGDVTVRQYVPPATTPT